MVNMLEKSIKWDGKEMRKYKTITKARKKTIVVEENSHANDGDVCKHRVHWLQQRLTSGRTSQNAKEATYSVQKTWDFSTHSYQSKQHSYINEYTMQKRFHLKCERNERHEREKKWFRIYERTASPFLPINNAMKNNWNDCQFERASERDGEREKDWLFDETLFTTFAAVLAWQKNWNAPRFWIKCCRKIEVNRSN